MSSKELIATWDSSREALVEVKEGKKLRKRSKEVKFQKSENKKKKKRENIEALYERLTSAGNPSTNQMSIRYTWRFYN